MTAIFIVHVFSTMLMTGIIWFVQIVHYPLFKQVGPDSFALYETQHTNRTGLVVGPLMILELSSAILLAAFPNGFLHAVEHLAGLLTLAIIWLSTALLQMPVHKHLTRGLDQKRVRFLTNSNWIRTAAWSFRAAIILTALTRLASG